MGAISGPFRRGPAETNGIVPLKNMPPNGKGGRDAPRSRRPFAYLVTNRVTFTRDVPNDRGKETDLMTTKKRSGSDRDPETRVRAFPEAAKCTSRRY